MTAKPNALDYITHKCKYCDTVLAFGEVHAMSVICPSCYQLNEITNVHNLDKVVHDTYGRKKLKLADMYRTKAEAIKAGHKHYFTGRLCINEHLAPKTLKGECLLCARKFQQAKRFCQTIEDINARAEYDKNRKKRKTQ